MLHRVADAAEGLAFERDLFEAKGSQVGLWASEARSVVCPSRYERLPHFSDATAWLAGIRFPVHLRPTGGGAVPQGPGSVNLALAFDAPTGFTIEDGYRLLTRTIITALGAFGVRLKTGDTPGSFCDGAWNLSVDDRKLVGTAQRIRPLPRGRKRVLAHALILADEAYLPGAKAVAEFHKTLCLAPIRAEAHTSLAACDTKVNLAEVLLPAAEKILAVSGPPENIVDRTIKGGKHVQSNHPHPS